MYEQYRHTYKRSYHALTISTEMSCPIRKK
uniref:Uncharacterized protein n=1 Tax=Anguilla anguilla TaxID=7936 RepID=A0A0E9XLJ4_ANGAN